MNKGIINKFRDKVAEYKLYIYRVQSYVGIINFGMIFFLFLDRLNTKEVVSLDINNYFLPLWFGWIFLLIFFGWIEVKYFQGHQKELNLSFNLNPQMVEMRRKLNYLYEKELKNEK